MRITLPALLLTLLAFACIDEQPAPVRDPVSIDVILDDDLASIYVRPIEREASCSFNPVLDGTCGIVWTDRIGCFFPDGEGPANRNSVYGCAEELRLGSTTAEDAFFHEGEEAGSGLLSGVVGGDRTLAVIGCGDDIVVPLDEVDAPAPAVASTLERVKGGERALARVEAEGASHVRICEDGGFSSECCDSTSGFVELPFLQRRGGCFARLSTEAIAGPSTTISPSGVVVRVWRRTVADLPSVSGVPEQALFGRWQSDVCVSGELGSFARVVFDPLDDTRFLLESEGGATIELARDVDTIRARTTDAKTYVGVVPHEPIDRLLPIGTFDELVIDIDHGDVVLANIDDASDTITVRAQLAGTIHGIPRP